MLVQKPYHHPYIPPTPKSLPYVGGELAELTSMTPFYRGQGEPIYPHAHVVRKTNLGNIHYGTIMVGLSQGASGKSVEDLQNALIDKGYYVQGGADGKFGSGTTAALKQFQKDNGLGQTGTVNADTKKKLEKVKGAGAVKWFDFAKDLYDQAQPAAGEQSGTTINVTPYQSNKLGLGAKIGIGIAVSALVIGTFVAISK